jgi:hypothetical protein
MFDEMGLIVYCHGDAHQPGPRRLSRLLPRLGESLARKAVIGLGLPASRRHSISQVAGRFGHAGARDVLRGFNSDDHAIP